MTLPAKLSTPAILGILGREAREVVRDFLVFETAGHYLRPDGAIDKLAEQDPNGRSYP